MDTNLEIKIKTKTQGTDEIKKLSTQLSALGKIESFKKLKKEIEETKTAWINAQAGVAKLAKEIKSAENPTKALSKQFKTAKNKALKLKTAFQQQLQKKSFTGLGLPGKGLSQH